MRVPAWLADNDAITRDFGWQPQIDIEQGFAQAYRWYQGARLALERFGLKSCRLARRVFTAS